MRTLVTFILFAGLASACPFCPAPGATLSTEVAEAKVIVFGTLTNAVRDPVGLGSGNGTTDLQLDRVIKDVDGFVNGRKVLTLPRYVPVDPKSTMKYLVFCGIVDGKLDPYRGEAVKPDSPIAEYLQGAQALKDASPAKRLAYFFKYLDSTDMNISTDAQNEFFAAEYKDFREAAGSYDPVKIASWLADPATPAARLGLYGSMLGLCGKSDSDARRLRAILDDPKKQGGSGLDGILAGYVQLDPKVGWDYLTKLIADDKQEFLVRYAGLRALRFFHEYRQDVVDVPRIVAAMQPLLDQADIADLPIEDLRKWERWEQAPRILELAGRPSHKAPIIKRSILKFAMTCPQTTPGVTAFLDQSRVDNAERMKDIEELLRIERDAKTKVEPMPKK